MTARMQVDLAAFEQNLVAVRNRVSPAELMLVVKDDAYGHGLAVIVNRATACGVRWFGAFDVATGIRVREIAGEQARIFVWMLSGPEQARAACAAGLDIGVGSMQVLEDVAAVGSERVHLKVDTGLHRNGIRPEQWPHAVARAREHEAEGRIRVIGVWSHIAEASDAEDDAARAVFDNAVRQAHRAGLNPEIRHLAASAAACSRPEFRYELARVGAFCYGIRSAGEPAQRSLGIRAIGSVRASVVDIEGGSVSLGIGSLDGLPSTLSGRFWVTTSAGQRRVTAVGRDALTVESWPGVRVGDEVIVAGAGACSYTDLAESMDTIGEEIAVRISPLLPREYCS